MFIKFFESFQELEDYAAKVAYSCFCKANIADEFSAWRDDAIQSALCSVIERADYINRKAQGKVIVARIMSASVFDLINKMAFADNGHYRKTGERYVEVALPERFDEEAIGTEDESGGEWGDEMESLLAQKLAEAGIGQAGIYAKIVVLKVRGYSYQGIANEVRLDYDVVRVYASRARSAMGAISGGE